MLPEQERVFLGAVKKMPRPQVCCYKHSGQNVEVRPEDVFFLLWGLLRSCWFLAYLMVSLALAFTPPLPARSLVLCNAPAMAEIVGRHKLLISLLPYFVVSLSDFV